LLVDATTTLPLRCFRSRDVDATRHHFVVSLGLVVGQRCSLTNVTNDDTWMDTHARDIVIASP
jgi:hypothetical protein